jgi:hypothetical protein
VDLQCLFWTKNIVPQGKEKWAYKQVDFGDNFRLSWKSNEVNANKPELGDLILLRQKGYVTHLVKVLDNELKYESWKGDFSIYRLVEVLWVTDWDVLSDSNRAELIFSYPVRYRSGNAMDLRTLPTFQKYWDGNGGLSSFQKQVREMLDLQD